MTNPTNAVATIDHARSFLLSPDVQKTLKDGMQKHMTPDRMCRLVLTAVQKSPKLVECFATPQGKRSVGLCMLTAAQIGLELDGRNAHLVPFKNKGGYMEAVFIPDFKGLINLAYNHPRVKDINVEVVYTNDVFVYRKGLNPVIEHTPTIDGEPGELRAVYAIATIDGTGKTFVVMSAREVDAVRRSSRGADQPDSPWNKWEASMWRKTACKQLCKIIPQSPELQRALAVEDEFEETGRTASSVTIDVKAEPEMKFSKQIATQAPPEQKVEEPGSASQSATDVDASTGNDATTAEKPNPKDSPQPAPAEPALATQLENFFRSEANAGFEDVKKTVLRLQPQLSPEWNVKSFAELTDQQLKNLWGGRRGTVREVRNDLKAK